MSTNMFSIEILYPSPTSGIMLRSWDVTEQIAGGTNYHIVIENSGIVIPDEGGGVTDGSGGFAADVEEWGDVQTVEIN